MLSQKLKEEFINKVVLQMFSGIMSHKIDSTIYDTEGKIIITTNMNAYNLGLEDGTQARGMSYKDVDVLLVKAKCAVTSEQDISKIIELSRQIYKIQQIAISQKIAISYIDIIPYNNIFEAMLVTNIPIAHPSGEVVALQATATKYKLFGIYDYLQQIYDTASHQQSYSICKGHKLPIKLSRREHEILFVLLTGVSQNQIAHILGITRGTVSKILTDKLCPKFGLYDGNTKVLIEKARKLNFDKFMPDSFYQPRIILLDQQVIEEYFKTS